MKHNGIKAKINVDEKYKDAVKKKPVGHEDDRKDLPHQTRKRKLNGDRNDPTRLREYVVKYFNCMCNCLEFLFIHMDEVCVL